MFQNNRTNKLGAAILAGSLTLPGCGGCQNVSQLAGNMITNSSPRTEFLNPQQRLQIINALLNGRPEFQGQNPIADSPGSEVIVLRDVSSANSRVAYMMHVVHVDDLEAFLGDATSDRRSFGYDKNGNFIFQTEVADPGPNLNAEGVSGYQYYNYGDLILHEHIDEEVSK